MTLRCSNALSASDTKLQRDISVVIPQYNGRQEKEANSYLRWNLLFTFLILLFISSCFWIPVIPGVQNFSLEIVIIFFVLVHLMWMVATFNALRYTWILRKYARNVNKINEGEVPSREMKIKHLVGICIYKEPLKLLMDTIDSIARQPNCKQKISLFLGIEDGTPDKEQKIRDLRIAYGCKFDRLIIAVHPRNLPGDIPGKCSNLNYAARYAVQQLRADKLYEMGPKTELLVTTGDCDSIFGDRYFEALEEQYWNQKEEKRPFTVWQSPLFYCMNSEKSPFFVRVTGLLRSFFMLGFLIPLNINTMSIFSLTLSLFESGGFTHPGYQMEDIIAVIRWSLTVRRQCIIQMIPVATLSGPTSGDNYLHELYEWARQIRRWTIGAAEVFHYFCIKSLRLPFSVSVTFSLKFLFYYGFLLCIASVYTIIAPIVTPLMLTAMDREVKGLVIPSRNVFTIVTLSFLGLQYFWFFCVFAVNQLCEKVFPQKIKDETGCVRNLFHYVMSLPTITMYCLVELWAFAEVTIRGKAVCSHSASKKDNLVVPESQPKPFFMEV